MLTAFHVRVLEVAPLTELEQDAETWDDALVLVHAGAIEVACAAGACRRFRRGDVLRLASLPVRTVRNPAGEVARLILITRGEHTMLDQSYTTTFTVDQPADRVFDAINDPRNWWGEGIEGSTTAVGDEFVHQVEGVHWAKLEVTELVPNERVVWRVVENRFDFVDAPTEWVGTTIRFELTPTGSGTNVSFEHQGLTPADECYEVCETAWGSLMHGSLPRLIESGVGEPYPRVFEEHRA